MSIRPKKRATKQSVYKMTEAALNTKRRAVFEAFRMAGEEAVTYARDVVNTYLDQTSNLRSSIGFTVAEKGVVKETSSFEQLPPKNPHPGDVYDGGDRGKTKVLQLVREAESSDFLLVLVAGMPYADYVQRLYHLDVLNGAGLVMEKELKENLSVIK